MKILTAKEFYRQRLIELEPEGIMKRLAKVVSIDKQAQICEDYHQYMVTTINLIHADDYPKHISQARREEFDKPLHGELGTDINPPMDIYNNLRDEDLQRLRTEKYKTGDPKLRYLHIPIFILEADDADRKGWTAEIADNWEDFAPIIHEEVNWEDLGFHFNFRGDIENGNVEDDYLFKTREDAIEAAVFINQKYLDDKAMIWFY